MSDAEIHTLFPIKPPLKWAGGKRWLVPHLAAYWEPFHDRRLVEPFCGSLALSLGLQPEQALLADINPHLINFFRQLQHGLTVDIPMRYDAALFYAHRERFNQLIRDGDEASVEAAQLFYYLNRTGFNGLCRFNRKGEFNVPFGKYTTINYKTDFTPYRAALAAWEFSIGKFNDLPIDPADFIYADPPYDVPFVSYSKEGFTWEDQVALAEWLAQHPGPVALSNQATERIIALYERLGFTLRYFESPRRISANGDRTPAREVLALNRALSTLHNELGIRTP